MEILIIESNIDTDIDTGTNSYLFKCRTFNTIEEAANYLKTKPYFVSKVIKGKKIKGTAWKPNIFFKNNKDKSQNRFIVVDKEEWNNYSNAQRINRLVKIMDFDFFKII